jgi:hypothetical protein
MVTWSEIINEASSLVPIVRLRLDQRSVEIALRDLVHQRWSHTVAPVQIFGEYEVRDGYHRVLAAILRGDKRIRCTWVTRPADDLSPPVRAWRYDASSPTFGLETFLEPAVIEHLKTMAVAQAKPMREDVAMNEVRGYHGSSSGLSDPTFVMGHTGNNSHTFGNYQSQR